MATAIHRVGGVLAAAVVMANILEVEAKKEPTALELQFAVVEKIVVLPAVDARSGEKAEIKLEDIRAKVLNSLEKKNYVVEPGEVSAGGLLIEEDVKEARPEWVKALGPDQARWILIVCLNDVMSKMTFGSAGNAEVTGYLYDKADGRLIWQAKGIGRAGQGGLAGMMMKGMMKGEALNKATENLLSGIPKRPKVKNAKTGTPGR